MGFLSHYFRFMQEFCWRVYSIYNYQMLFLLLYRLCYDFVTVLEIGYNLVVLYLCNYLRDDYIIEL